MPLESAHRGSTFITGHDYLTIQVERTLSALDGAVLVLYAGSSVLVSFPVMVECPSVITH